MSNRELAKNLIDQISDAKLLYVIPYLQGAALADETPNAETLEAMAESTEYKIHKNTVKFQSFLL